MQIAPAIEVVRKVSGTLLRYCSPMAWIRTVDEGDADGELAELYERVQDPHSGAVDNIMRIHALHPRGLAAHFELYRAVMRPTKGLPGAEREMIALVVSRINACHY